MFHILLQINVNAGRQKFMLGSLAGLFFTIWAAKAAASAVDRIWCSSWEHAGWCEPAVRGFSACLAGHRVTRTHSAPPERALLRTKGFCVHRGKQQHVV